MESRSQRQVMGALARGADLVEGLLGAVREAGARAGTVRAQGVLERVEIGTLDLGSGRFRPPRVWEACELVSLSGHLAVRNGELDLSAKIMVAREREIAGGHLVSGRVFAVEYVLSVWDDVALGRPTSPGYQVWGPEIAKAPAGPVTWQTVAAASAPADDPTPEEEDTIAAGDVLMHATFGRCEVQRIEGNHEFAHVRLKNGRLVRLSLDVLKVVPAGSEGGRRVFKARVDG